MPWLVKLSWVWFPVWHIEGSRTFITDFINKSKITSLSVPKQGHKKSNYRKKLKSYRTCLVVTNFQKWSKMQIKTIKIVSITLFDESEHLSNFYLENVTKILEFHGNSNALKWLYADMKWRWSGYPEILHHAGPIETSNTAPGGSLMTLLPLSNDSLLSPCCSVRRPPRTGKISISQTKEF